MQQQIADVRGLRDSVRGDMAAAAHQLFQRDGIVELEHPHLRLGFLAAGRFQPHLGHAEQAMQQRLVHGHVVDARERDLPQAAFEQPAA